jgi:hypothetical protein
MTIVGAGVAVRINGQVYGRCQNFHFSAATARHPIYGIDSLEPFELAPTVSRVAGSLSIVRTVGDAGAEGAGMSAPLDMLPREKYFALQLVERGSDLVIFDARYCSVASQNWNVERGAVIGTIEFEALDWNNEITSR